MKSIKNIAIAGTGNVATHLARNLAHKGYRISGIWSRNFANAQALAGSCNTEAFSDIKDLTTQADLVIIAVTDSAIEQVARSIGEFDGIAVHTAGSVNMSIFKGVFKHYGVLYPLQTMSKEIPVSFSEVPFFLEASSEDTLLELKKTALNLSAKVYEADSQQRMLVHTAAVFTGNYSNLMYIIGNELLKLSGLPPEVLFPLIMETSHKAVTGDPLQFQTGPARRNDFITIEKHIEALASLPEYAELYRLLANIIIKKYE
jgi:predicted short-subunit dehydrogenase-like oxidoreductase (DUF2520 family)